MRLATVISGGFLPVIWASFLRLAFTISLFMWIRSSRATIVKLSANPSYGISENEAENKDAKHGAVASVSESEISRE